jgi:hypothetical protein
MAPIATGHEGEDAPGAAPTSTPAPAPEPGFSFGIVVNEAGQQVGYNPNYADRDTPSGVQQGGSDAAETTEGDADNG